MSSRLKWSSILFAAVATGTAVLPFLPGAQGQPPAKEAVPAAKPPAVPAQAFTGSNRCYICHRKQAKMFDETKHAKAFEHLPVKYRNDAACLKCHVTAFGEPTGYVLGASADAIKPFLDVGCEVCHGPGELHEVAVKKWTNATPEDEERLLKDVKATTRRIPPDRVCATCHLSQGHKSHPYYEGQRGGHAVAQMVAPPAAIGCECVKPPWDTLELRGPSKSPTTCRMIGEPAPAAVASVPCQPPAYFSVKTCGGCHYDQYKNWGTSKHAALFAKVPAKYQDNAECQACHPRSHSNTTAAGTDPHAQDNRIGLACESCHGPAREHVVFNRRLIGSWLGLELEQAARETIRKDKPVAACVQCHLRHGHKEHPEFDRHGK